MQFIKQFECNIPQLNTHMEKEGYLDCFRVKVKPTTFVHNDNSTEHIDLLNPLVPVQVFSVCVCVN